MKEQLFNSDDYSTKTSCFGIRQPAVAEWGFITRADGSSQLMLAFSLSATIFIEQPRDTFNDT